MENLKSENKKLQAEKEQLEKMLEATKAQCKYIVQSVLYYHDICRDAIFEIEEICDREIKRSLFEPVLQDIKNVIIEARRKTEGGADDEKIYQMSSLR